VLKYAIIALIALIGLLIVIALIPEGERVVPNSTIELSDAQLILYPQADPDAVWSFKAPSVEYEPGVRETTLLNIEDGRRTENGETDFTLESERTTIDSDDNLRGEKIDIHLLEEDWDLDMQAKNGQLVLIRQREGVFEVPYLSWVGDGGNGINENMTISFDLTQFSSGGEGTVGISEFELDDRNGNGE